MIKFRNENYGVETILKGGNSDLAKAIICGEGDTADFTGITKIASSVGYYNKNVKNVIIDKETESIPDRFFHYSKVESIDFSECINLHTIDVHFFANCSNLQYVDLSDCVNLTTIGGSFLYACDNLQHIKLGALTPPILGGSLNIKSFCSIYVPDESVDAYKNAPRWSDKADQIKPMSEAPQL